MSLKKEKHRIFLEIHIFRRFDLEEIQENDFNLNVSRYIDILPEEEPIDVTECIVELRKLQGERMELEEEFEKNMRELGYD